jgi:hypothetical protein
VRDRCASAVRADARADCGLARPPNADARARQILALWSGFALYTFQLTVSSGRDKVDPSMVDWLAQSLQAIVDQR